MEKPGDISLSGLIHHRLEPCALQRFLALSAAEQQCVEPDQTPIFDIFHPPVGAEMRAPALESFLITGLMVMAGIADIMVAGYSPKSHAQTVHEFGSVPEILFDVGAIDSDVAGMDDEVGMLLDDPPCERRPIGIEMRHRVAIRERQAGARPPIGSDTAK